MEVESQAEFDAKRPELLKALAGERFDCLVKARSGVYGDEKAALAPRRAAIKAQDEMLAYWSGRWDAHMTALKEEIDELLRA